MTIFPIPLEHVRSLYHRVLRRSDLCPGPVPVERKDFLTLSAEAKRQKILEETRSAVLSRIRSGP